MVHDYNLATGTNHEGREPLKVLCVSRARPDLRISRGHRIGRLPHYAFNRVDMFQFVWDCDMEATGRWTIRELSPEPNLIPSPLLYHVLIIYDIHEYALYHLLSFLFDQYLKFLCLYYAERFYSCQIHVQYKIIPALKLIHIQLIYNWTLGTKN